jgi:hypothetical protein
MGAAAARAAHSPALLCSIKKRPDTSATSRSMPPEARMNSADYLWLLRLSDRGSSALGKNGHWTDVGEATRLTQVEVGRTNLL